MPLCAISVASCRVSALSIASALDLIITAVKFSPDVDLHARISDEVYAVRRYEIRSTESPDGSEISVCRCVQYPATAVCSTGHNQHA